VTPRKAIREKCLDCMGGGGAFKAVKFCPSDGINSTKCPLWEHRFGMTAGRAAKVHGRQYLDPKQMPDANTALEELPTPSPVLRQTQASLSQTSAASTLAGLTAARPEETQQ